MRGENARFGERHARQFSLWPFGIRSLRLFLLVDPSSDDPTLTGALLRAMRAEYFRTEGRSLTSAMGSALRAAHYLLRDYNAQHLPHERGSAAAACAVTRGERLYVALAGEAAALTWDGEHLARKLGSPRVARPLGGDAAPSILFWSAPLEGLERLVLICGAAWRDDSLPVLEDLLGHADAASVEDAVSDAVSGPHGRARVLVAERAAVQPPSGHVADRPRRTPRADEGGGVEKAHTSRRASRAGLAVSGAVVVAAVALLLRAFGAHAPLPREAASAAGQAEAMATEAVQTSDVGRAYQLASSAVALAQASGGPDKSQAQALVSASKGFLQGLGPVTRASERVAVPASQESPSSIADIAYLGDTLLVLDGPSGVVRVAAPAAAGLTNALFRPGTLPSGQVARRAVAIATAPIPGGGSGAIVIDRNRSILRSSPGSGMQALSPPILQRWSSLADMAASDSTVYFVNPTGRIVALPLASATSGPPALLTVGQAPLDPGETVSHLSVAGDLYVSTSRGRVLRVSANGQAAPFSPAVGGHPLGPVSALGVDANHHIYLADPSHDCIAEVTPDGAVVRRIVTSPGSLDGVNQIAPRPDGAELAVVSARGVVELTLGADAGSPPTASPASGSPPAG